MIMIKYPKWKVALSYQANYMIDVEAQTQQQAIDKAVKEFERNPEYYQTSNATLVTGVFINDREARDYQLFVPESLPQRS